MATKLDALRKIIREEVISAMRKEIPVLIAEQFERQRQLNESRGTSNLKEKFEKKTTPKIPGTLNTAPAKPVAPKFSANNPLGSLLQETAMSMQEDDFIGMTTDDINPIEFFQPKEASVGDISGMLSTARPSSSPELVQINEVPDFTSLMQKMLQNGTI